jgi:hypothetical protein
LCYDEKSTCLAKDMVFFEEWTAAKFPRVELSLCYGRQSVDQFVLVSGSLLGPMTRFYPYPFFSDNCFVVLPVGCPLWWEDGYVTYSAITDWSGHWGPITVYYRLIWDCSLFVTSYDSQGLRRRYSDPPPHGVNSKTWKQKVQFTALEECVSNDNVMEIIQSDLYAFDICFDIHCLSVSTTSNGRVQWRIWQFVSMSYWNIQFYH